MTEPLKTVSFVACAAVVAALAWVARPVDPGRGVVDDAGELFFAEFTDPLRAASLEIIGFDETNGTTQVFKVARHNGVWSIPSHENYPADAENQFANAAASMIGLVRGVSVSDSRVDHPQFDVVDPLKADAGSIGVGKRVRLAGEDGRSITDLIIGKAVKDSDGQHYVRVPDIDRVYLCTIDVEKFSTGFDEWIEKDLLELNIADIRGVIVNDYAIDEFSQRVIQGETVTLSYDQTQASWSLDGLAENEQLVEAKLTDLRRGLDDLQIVDVHRKPAGLSSELRAEDTMQLDTQAVQSLQNRGYYIVGGRLLSNQGETVVQTEGCVQYRLRFGEIAVPRGGTEELDAEAGRYLFVTAECNPDLIPKPQLMELPDLESLGISTDAEVGSDEESASTQPSMSEAMELAREKLEQENQRKQQEYDTKLAQGRARASELTDRFADWYYVISDSVYDNIRLTRADIVEAAAADDG
jgi:hypothetical protein